MPDEKIVIAPARSKSERAAFVDLGRRFSAHEPQSVPQLRSEQLELVDPAKNPFFGHATAELLIARRAGEPVGRIAAHIDHLVHDLPTEQGMGPGTGFFGYFDASDEEVARTLLDTAEAWLREHGMSRVLGPISLSIWEEPGLLVKGQDHAPMIMMGHHPQHYAGWIEQAGYCAAKRLLTYDMEIREEFPPLVRRIIASGDRNPRIRIRPVDTRRWDEEVATILTILNDAWSRNWGFVPFTPEEIAHAGKKLKPVIFEDLNMIAELDGRPVAFMLTLPDINDLLARIDGRLFPFGWVRLLAWLRKPRGMGMRVPLMGVLRELQNSRLASQLAFMLIDRIRHNAFTKFASRRAEIGWILDDNQGMMAIADAIGSRVNREYVIYEKALSLTARGNRDSSALVSGDVPETAD